MTCDKCRRSRHLRCSKNRCTCHVCAERLSGQWVTDENRPKVKPQPIKVKKAPPKPKPDRPKRKKTGGIQARIFTPEELATAHARLAAGEGRHKVANSMGSHYGRLVQSLTAAGYELPPIFRQKGFFDIHGEEMLELRAQGFKVKVIAEHFGVNDRQVERAIARARQLGLLPA